VLSRRSAEPLIFVFLVGVTRFAFRSRDLYDLDSVNFALAISRFDPRSHQPHPPGYFLYILLGRIVNYMVDDANLALVLISVLASCATAFFVFCMTEEWFGASSARFAAAIFLCSPLAWFHGTVALTYSVEALSSVLLGVICWGIFCGRFDLMPVAGLTLAVAAGIRPSSLMLLGPLVLFSGWRAPWKCWLAGLAIFLVTVAAWFFPMIRSSGGTEAYFGALVSLWRLVPGQETVFNSSPATSMARAATILLIYLLMFGAAVCFPFSRAARRSEADRDKTIFTLYWIAPTIAFHTLVFLKFVNSGYLLLLVAPGCLWLGHWGSLWLSAAAARRAPKLVLLGLAIVANITLYAASPFYCSYRSVRQFEAELADVQRTLPSFGSPADMLIVGFDSHFLGYRHAGYYLPEYETIEYPEVRLVEGVRVFAMYERSTQLLPSLSRGSFRQFILFPLPMGDAGFTRYLNQVEKLVPASDLHTTVVRGHMYVVGPIRDLPLLFPETASSAQTVSPPLHPAGEAVNSR
jgi:hypothetical protein